MARVAGSARTLLVAVALLLGIHAAAVRAGDRPAQPDHFLLPTSTLVGGFATERGGAANGYTKLVAPSALAAFGNNLYVADRGLGALLRIDLATQRVTTLGRIPLSGPVRMRTGADGTLYLLLPNRSEILRLTPNGDTLLRYGDIGVVPSPIDLVIEPLQQRLWVLDASGELFEFMPLGPLLRPIGRDTSGPLLTMFATGAKQLLSLDTSCQCVYRIDSEGFAVARFGEGQIRQPVAADIDRFGRLWVFDRSDNLVKIFADEQLVAEIRPSALGLLTVSAIAFDFDRAFLAEGPGGRILTYTLLAPKPAPPK